MGGRKGIGTGKGQEGEGRVRGGEREEREGKGRGRRRERAWEGREGEGRGREGRDEPPLSKSWIRRWPVIGAGGIVLSNCTCVHRSIFKCLISPEKRLFHARAYRHILYITLYWRCAAVVTSLF